MRRERSRAQRVSGLRLVRDIMQGPGGHWWRAHRRVVSHRCHGRPSGSARPGHGSASRHVRGVRSAARRPRAAASTAVAHRPVPPHCPCALGRCLSNASSMQCERNTSWSRTVSARLEAGLWHVSVSGTRAAYGSMQEQQSRASLTLLQRSFWRHAGSSNMTLSMHIFLRCCERAPRWCRRLQSQPSSNAASMATSPRTASPRAAPTQAQFHRCLIGSLSLCVSAAGALAHISKC